LPSDPPATVGFVERRSGIDRRRRAFVPLPLINPYRRRRSKGRRKTDKGAYVDTYDFQTWTIAISILLLSLLDALLTGFHVLHGTAEEVNPILNAALVRGGIPFFISVKAILTVLPLAIIVLHKEWKLGKRAAWVCLLSYVLISLYHLYLILRIHRGSEFFSTLA